MIVFITLVLASSVMIQETVEGLKKYFSNLVNKNFKAFFNQSLAIGLGVSSALIYKLDLIALFTSETTLLGLVMTGILLSQGADSVRNVLKKLKGVKDEAETYTNEWYANQLKELPMKDVDAIYTEVIEASDEVTFGNDLYGSGIDVYEGVGVE